MLLRALRVHLSWHRPELCARLRPLPGIRLNLGRSLGTGRQDLAPAAQPVPSGVLHQTSPAEQLWPLPQQPQHQQHHHQHQHQHRHQWQQLTHRKEPPPKQSTSTTPAPQPSSDHSSSHQCSHTDQQQHQQLLGLGSGPFTPGRPQEPPQWLSQSTACHQEALPLPPLPLPLPSSSALHGFGSHQEETQQRQQQGRPEQQGKAESTPQQGRPRGRRGQQPGGPDSSRGAEQQAAYLAQLTDMRTPAAWYPGARALTRTVIAHLGPTNSGKTHAALEAMKAAKGHALYCGPLRLLACSRQAERSRCGLQPADRPGGQGGAWGPTQRLHSGDGSGGQRTGV